MTDSQPLHLSPHTHAQLALLAQAWNTTPAHTIQRLLDAYRTTAPTPPPPAPDTVSVYAIYARQRIHGRYDPNTRSVTLTDGPAPGPYKTPSGASAAVVRALNPDVPPIRNGWHFWRLTKDGQPLNTLRTPRHTA
ncbi:hypothetical protein OG897_36575 [Streptomyces sp. NBC_00237]|uniref:hypothetical protein n=1 Tax=Streptomyces sp. NBC_00237 TaxID=2975687 RepID=UPI0022530FB8|nr:hypothetical protein [Streptomyces sp. NBC_00237]MCX5206904.1 hypothetical protein [Streptomyces sp. NBC_00237]